MENINRFYHDCGLSNLGQTSLLLISVCRKRVGSKRLSYSTFRTAPALSYSQEWVLLSNSNTSIRRRRRVPLL